MYRSKNMDLEKSLYNLIHEEIHRLNNLDINSNDGLKEIGNQLAIKADNVANYLTYLDDQLEIVTKRIEAMNNVKRALKERITRFEDYIQSCLELNNGPIKGNDKVFKLVTNPPSVEIIDQDKLDIQYIEIRQEIVVKKKEILEDFKKTGEIPDGVNIVQKKRVKMGDV